jgi:hypothetical protein
MTPIRVRIFVSSPGDVTEERAVTRRVLDDLQYDPLLRGKVLLEAVSWDDPRGPAPMIATLTPQEAVNRGLPKPSDCDLVVVILWSRMGTPLVATRADGVAYLSGTEYEFEDAKRAGRPVLLYRRLEKPTLSIDDADLDEKRKQWRLVNEFFRKFVAPGGSLRAAYTSYTTPAEFRERLEIDLRTELKRILSEGPMVDIASTPDVMSPDTLKRCLGRLGLKDDEATRAIDWMREELLQRSADDWSARRAREEALRKSSPNSALNTAIDFLHEYIECTAPSKLTSGPFYVSAAKIGQMYRGYRLGESKSDATVEDKFHKVHEHFLKSRQIVFLPAGLLLGEPLPTNTDALVYFTMAFVLTLDDELFARFPSAKRALESGGSQDLYGLVTEIFQCPDPMTYSLIQFTGTLAGRPARMVLSRKHIVIGSMTATSLSQALARRPVDIAGFGTLQAIDGDIEIAPLICRFAEVSLGATAHAPEAPAP